MMLCNVRKVSVRKSWNLGPPRSHQLQVSVAKIVHISSIQEAFSLLFSLFLLLIACWLFCVQRLIQNYDKWMLRHMQKLLGHVPEYAGAWLRHCLVLVAYVHVPCIVAADTIRGWGLFSSELLIVRLVFWGRQLFEGSIYSKKIW